MLKGLELLGITAESSRGITLAILVFAGLAGILSLPLAYTIDGAIFAILGLAFLGRRLVKRSPIIEQSFIGRLPLLFVFFALSGLVINLWHGAKVSSYEMFIPFLWAPLIFLVVADNSFDRRVLWSGSATGAVLALFVAAFQALHLGIDRPDGFALSPITFGNNALLLGAVGAMGRHDSPRKVAGWLWYVLVMLGLVAGIVTSLLSQSRGGWPLVILVLLWVFFSDFPKGGTKAKILSAITFLAFIFALCVHPPTSIISRLELAYTGVSGWIETGHPVDGSVGARLELWRFGLSIWPENPWLGHGETGLMARKAALIEAGKFDPVIGQFTALHNEFIQLLVQKGLFGAVAWIAMFIGSFAAFYRASKSVSPGIQRLGQAGLVVVVGSLVFGLTDMNLMLNANRQIFVYLVMIVSGFINREATGAELPEKEWFSPTDSCV